MSLNNGYLIKYEEIIANINTFIKQIDKWRSEIEDLEKKYLQLTEFDGIQGETAEAIKEDSNKFALIAIEHIYIIFDKFRNKLEEYRDNYLDIDYGFSVFSSEDFINLEKNIVISKEFINKTSRNIDRILIDIKDLVTFDTPSSYWLLVAHDNTRDMLLEIRDKVEECEKIDGELNNIEASIDALSSFLKAKEFSELETNFKKIEMMSRNLYPDVKFDAKTEKLEIAEELKNISKETSKEIIETPEVYDGIGILSSKLFENRTGESLKVNGKLEKVSNFLKGNAEKIAKTFENLGYIFETAEFISGTNKNLSEGYPYGQAVFKNLLPIAGAALGGIISNYIVGSIFGVLLTPPAFAIITTVAIGLGIGYYGKEIGEALYYSIYENKIKTIPFIGIYDPIPSLIR